MVYSALRETMALVRLSCSPKWYLL